MELWEKKQLLRARRRKSKQRADEDISKERTQFDDEEEIK